MKDRINHTYLLIVLSLLSTVAPISIATYLPSMPIMAEYFKVPISDIELSLSIFMFGFAIGQIFGGYFSDKKGRKVSSLSGLFGFAMFSLLIIFSTTVYELWIYRFIQALFAGLIVVNATAIARDMFAGKEAARFFSLLGSLRSIVPMMAPVVGSFILFFASWEAIFISMILFALVLAFIIIKDFDETCSFSNKKGIIASYKEVFENKKAVMMMLVIALGFTSLFSIVTKSSFIYMEHYNISATLFPFYYGVNFVLIVFFASYNVKLIKRFKQLSIIKTVVALQIFFAVLFTFFSENLNLYSAMVLLGLYVGMNGFIYGNGTALVMENFPKNGGVASALIGVIQFGMASIISSIIVAFHGETLLSVGIGMLLISTLSFLILRKYTL